MSNPELPANDRSKAASCSPRSIPPSAKLTYLRGWERSRWWNSPMFFWDDFSADGELGPESKDPGPGGRALLGRTIAPGADADYTFLLAWHFPNRTPRRCGWSAAPGDEDTSSATTTPRASPTPGQPPNTPPESCPRWKRRRAASPPPCASPPFPPAIKDAAMSNLSTLVTPVCFRTADGEFHGFEGANDHNRLLPRKLRARLELRDRHRPHFPTLARSLRGSAFGYQKTTGRHPFPRTPSAPWRGAFGYAAADGQMGQIMHAYLDWRLSGDTAWLREMWPRIKKAIEFAWIPGGWDANKDGVLEGVQHNTYDVEFYGPNPQCGIFYLGALRAGEEMARAVGDTASAAEYRALFERGSQWIDANLFNGEFYIQKIRGIAKDKIAPAPGRRHGLGQHRKARVPGRRRLPARSVDRPVSGRCRRPRPAGLHRQHPQDARVHLALQLQAHARRPRSACSAPTC
jgi:non-lysosomal glucosylceramidase